MNLRKVIIFSSLISASIVVWYEILGMKFILALLFLIIIYLTLSSRGSNRNKGGHYD